MYDNIGSKIKGLAKGVFVVEAIAAFISGIVIMSDDEDLIAIGLLVMLLGPVVAWVSSWLLYGFGELIDKVCDIERNTHGEELKKEQTKNEIPQQDTVRQDVTNQKEEKATPNRIINSDYKFKWLKHTDKYSNGTCKLCFKEYEHIELCAAKNDVGIREILICPECIKKIEQNLTQ